MLSIRISYPYLIKFHYSADNSQEGGDEASNEGCNSGPTGHDFMEITLMAANSRNRISRQAMRSRPHGVKGPPFFFLGTLFLIINIFVRSSSPF